MKLPIILHYFFENQHFQRTDIQDVLIAIQIDLICDNLSPQIDLLFGRDLALHTDFQSNPPHHHHWHHDHYHHRYHHCQNQPPMDRYHSRARKHPQLHHYHHQYLHCYQYHRYQCRLFQWHQIVIRRDYPQLHLRLNRFLNH